MKKIKNIIIYTLSLIVEFIIIFYFAKDPNNLRFSLWTSVFKICLFNIAIGVIMLPIVFWITIAKKSVKYEKFSKEDLIKNNQLYREILNDISPALLSYIDNMDFNYESMITSTLLLLKSKNYISFNNDKILRTKKCNTSGLSSIEDNILSNISNGKAYITKDEFKNNIISEAIKKDLVQENYNIEEKIEKKAIILITIFICIFAFTFITLIIFDNFLSFIGIIVLLTFPIGSIIYIFTYIHKYNNNPLFRTRKGKEINKRLEGLKNYIKEYSLLEEKDDNSIQLWEDYLIYSVIFKQNNLILQEYSQYIILE